MSRFAFIETGIAGLRAVRRAPLQDNRGFLERMYCVDELEPVLGRREVRQINRTLTREAGVVRGLHFQRPPKAETKVVSCLKGTVFDVAVDLRKGSPTFLQWHGRVLSAENHESMVIPEGFAHGLQTLESDCELLYLHTETYAPSLEDGLNALDPRLGIAWPLTVSFRSDKDAGLPGTDYFVGIAL